MMSHLMCRLGLHGVCGNSFIVDDMIIVKQKPPAVLIVDSFQLETIRLIQVFEAIVKVEISRNSHLKL